MTTRDAMARPDGTGGPSFREPEIRLAAWIGDLDLNFEEATR